MSLERQLGEMCAYLLPRFDPPNASVLLVVLPTLALLPFDAPSWLVAVLVAVALYVWVHIPAQFIQSVTRLHAVELLQTYRDGTRSIPLLLLTPALYDPEAPATADHLAVLVAAGDAYSAWTVSPARVRRFRRAVDEARRTQERAGRAAVEHADRADVRAELAASRDAVGDPIDLPALRQARTAVAQRAADPGTVLPPVVLDLVLHALDKRIAARGAWPDGLAPGARR